jgi:heptose-I-phosphate ethanolaminephosphotransferase
LLPFYLSMILFQDAERPDIFFICLNYAAFLLAAGVALPLPGPAALYMSLLFAALSVPIAVTASYAAIYGAFPGAQVFYCVWETNTREASEFIVNALGRSWRVLPVFVLSFALPLPPAAYLIYKSRWIKSRVGVWRRLALSLGCAAALVGMRHFGALGSNAVYLFYYTMADYRDSVRIASDLRAGAPEKLAGEEVSGPAGPETCVIVIGESASRHHWGLYGYPRRTTPEMSSLVSDDGALAFSNVSSSSILTTQSLMRALSPMDVFSRVSDFSFSVVDVLNRAGFKTWWLSNNAVMPQHDTLLEALWGNASVKRFTEGGAGELSSMTLDAGGRAERPSDKGKAAFDGAMLGWFAEALADPAPKKAIFVHLKGSHVQYWYRFPKNFEVFKTSGDFAPPAGEMSGDDFSLMNDYDNSILYTDHVLGQIVLALKGAGGVSWLLYFSDHGSEEFDFRRFSGRDAERPSKYMFDVPFILWTSGERKKSRGRAEILPEYLERPYSLDGLFYTILDLAGVRAGFMDEGQSVVSAGYETPARIVNGAKGYLTYLELPPESLFNPDTVEDEKRALEKFAGE